MSGSAKLGAWLQLTRLFLKQFLENDLVSPDGDRAQLLAIVGAGVVSLTLFASMFLSAPYSMTRLTPGQAALLTLNDKFFYVSLAMLMTGLIAAAQWDALSLDQRDAAILDPLPVPAWIVRAGKLTAVAMLGASAAVAINIFPSVLFPWMLAFAVPQMTAVDVFRMMAIHAMVTVTAAVFGYVAILTAREALSALLGPRLFARLSASLQAITIVAIGSLLLLLPPVSTRIAQRGFSGWFAALPPMSFVGLYEVASREFIADLPRTGLSARMARRDPGPTAVYEARRIQFPAMALRVQILFGGTAALLVVSTLVSAFRAPVGGALLAAGRRRRFRIFDGIVNALLVRRPAARAGFHFAWATLFRSKTHRLTLACAAAVGLAMIFFVLSRIDLQSGRVSVGVLIVQPLLYGCLLVGFRHLIRVPAELRANWGVRLAWRDHPRAFREGVSRAALVALAIPAVLTVVPLVALIGDLTIAIEHAALGVVGAAIMLDVLMLGYQKAPFTCNYVPGGAKALVPIFVLAFLIGANLFARLELAILNGSNVVRNVLFLAAILGGLRIVSAFQREPLVDFDEGPASFAELRLGG